MLLAQCLDMKIKLIENFECVRPWDKHLILLAPEFSGSFCEDRIAALSRWTLGHREGRKLVKFIEPGFVSRSDHYLKSL